MELRVTDTNSANDSKGRAFGLEGNNFLYILIAFVAALGGYLVLNVFLGVGMLAALTLTLPILLLPAGWVLLLKHNRPEGYAGDLFDSVTNREGWSFAPRVQSSHV
jgi:hypothetical protein